MWMGAEEDQERLKLKRASPGANRRAGFYLSWLRFCTAATLLRPPVSSRKTPRRTAAAARRWKPNINTWMGTVQKGPERAGTRSGSVTVEIPQTHIKLSGLLLDGLDSSEQSAQPPFNVSARQPAQRHAGSDFRTDRTKTRFCWFSTFVT